MRAWRMPCADERPSSVARRRRSLPSTETNTVPSRRSGVTRTPVTVTSPIRGSFSSPIPSATTARTDSLTRRMRSLTVVTGCDEQAVTAHEHRFARREPSLGAGGQLLGLVRGPRRAGDGERRTLPEVVVVDLGDRGAEAAAQRVPRRAHVVALALQRAGFGEVQLDGEDRDVPVGQGGSDHLGCIARRRGCTGRLVERRALDLTRLEDLEYVALAQVVEPVEEDAALEALAHLADVVLEAAELRDGGLVDPRSLAEDAHVRAAAHDAARDHAACNRAEPRDAEQCTHLHLTEDRLGLDRRQQPDERLLDVGGELVDDAVEADLDALPIRGGTHLGGRADVEADHH